MPAITKPVMDDSLSRHGREYNLHNPGVYQAFALSVHDTLLVRPLPPRATFPFEPTHSPAPPTDELERDATTLLAQGI